MRDDHGRALEGPQERLEPREAGEVEVVRRLVEQEDVEAAENDRGKSRTRSLAAGEARERTIDVCGEAELGERRRRPHLEIAAAAREEGVERLVVLDRQLRLGREQLGEVVHARRGGRDARAAREVREQRLTRERVALLGQVADRERRRQAPHGAAIRHLQGREQPQQRRLADAVRPHEPDARVRRHDEVDVRENDLTSVGLRDADRGERADRAHVHLLTRTTPSNKLLLGRNGMGLVSRSWTARARRRQV